MTTYLINNRALTRYHSFEDTLNENKNYLFDLSYLESILLQGEKAVDFLQQQITSDLRCLSEEKMTPGAFCNLKGRILSLADCVSWNGLQCIVPKDLSEKIKMTLSKPALLSRVPIETNRRVKLFGFYLQNQHDLLPIQKPLPKERYAQISTSNYCTYHIGHGLYIFLIPEERVTEFCSVFIENNQLLGSLSWHTVRLLNHQVDIYPESSGLFIPHRLSLHETVYLAFDKGCYKGQEVIARMHYLARLKHELKFYTIRTSEKLYSGQRLFSQGVEVGELIDYAPLLEEEYRIAVSVLKGSLQTLLLEGHKDLVHLQ